MKIYVSKRGWDFPPLFFFCLIFFISCSQGKELRWHYDEDTHASPQYRSARLYYPTENPFDGLEIEILKGRDEIVYLNVLRRSIPAYQDDASKALVTIRTDNEQQNFIVQRLRGGQRLKLPHKATLFLIDNLREVDYVHILLDGYEAKIPSQQFKKQYCKL